MTPIAIMPLIFEVSSLTFFVSPYSYLEWSADLLELCKEFQNDTVVGIDLANNESLELYEEHKAAFQVLTVYIVYILKGVHNGRTMLSYIQEHIVCS